MGGRSKVTRLTVSRLESDGRHIIDV